MSKIDIAAIERLLAAAVAYRKSKSSGDNWLMNAAAAKVIGAARAIATPARLTAREARIIAAANAYRDALQPALKGNALKFAAMQPEEAADDNASA